MSTQKLTFKGNHTPRPSQWRNGRIKHNGERHWISHNNRANMQTSAVITIAYLFKCRHGWLSRRWHVHASNLHRDLDDATTTTNIKWSWRHCIVHLSFTRGHVVQNGPVFPKSPIWVPGSNGRNVVTEGPQILAKREKGTGHQFARRLRKYVPWSGIVSSFQTR